MSQLSVEGSAAGEQKCGSAMVRNTRQRWLKGQVTALTIKRLTHPAIQHGKQRQVVTAMLVCDLNPCVRRDSNPQLLLTGQNPDTAQYFSNSSASINHCHLLQPCSRLKCAMQSSTRCARNSSMGIVV